MRRADHDLRTVVDVRQFGDRGSWMPVNTVFFVTDSGRGIFEDNAISDSTFANVAVTRDSQPVLLRNEIYNSSEQGVNVYGAGRGIFDENNIRKRLF
jgi:predicted transcriptional regulator